MDMEQQGNSVQGNSPKQAIRKITLIIVGTKSGEAIRSARTKRRRLEMGCGCLFWLILAAAACLFVKFML